MSTNRYTKWNRKRRKTILGNNISHRNPLSSCWEDFSKLICLLPECFYYPTSARTGKQEAVSDSDTQVSTALIPHDIGTQLPTVWVWKVRTCGTVITWGPNSVNHESGCWEFWSHCASAKCRGLSGRGACVLWLCVCTCMCARVRGALKSVGPRKSWPTAFLPFSAPHVLYIQP